RRAEPEGAGMAGTAKRVFRRTAGRCGLLGFVFDELMLLQKGVATAGIHGNDVALFSYVLGEFLCSRRAEVPMRKDAPARLRLKQEDRRSKQKLGQGRKRGGQLSV